MKRLYQTLFLILIVPLWTNAQDATTTATPSSFSLDDCIKYALENTVDIKNARVDEQIADSKVKETIGIGLPQVDGSVGIQHNPKLPRFYSQYDPDQDAAFGDLSSIPGIQPGDLIALPNFFQQPSAGTAGITINQLLFNNSYLVGLKASDTYQSLSRKATQQTQIQVIENVAKAYYAVLVSNERIALFDNNIARVDSLLRTTRAMNENGFAEAIDVDRTQVTLNNLKTERLIFINTQRLSLGLLKFQMNFPMDQDLPISGKLEDLKINENLFTEYEQGWDYKDRIEYKILDTQKRLQELEIKNRFSQSTPSLVAFANLGYSTMSPNVGGLFKTESSVEKTDSYGPDSWYPYSTLGVTLNIPIFSGLQRSARLQQSKLELVKIENQYSSLKQAIDLSIQQNTIEYKNALESLGSQRENMNLADRVAKVTKIKYEQGVGSNIEVTDAENSLRAAQINYYGALFDAILAKINLERAYAKIDPAKYNTTTTK
jgi:outer membrane protein